MYKNHLSLLSPITQIQDNSHILGVYSSPQRKIEEGLEYLRIGFEEKNEAILMITNELTKNEVRNEIMKKWKIFPYKLADLEKNSIINIKSSTEVYFSTNRIDRDKIVKQFSNLVNKAIEKGKRGLRAFGDVTIFFERGYEKYIIDFEKSFPPSFDFPMTSICAYDLDDFEKLDHRSRKILFDHHNLHLANNLSRNIFDDSFSLSLTEHICMYYEIESPPSSFPIITNNGLLRYIDEGLRQNQLCVYLSMHNLEKDHPKTILSQIPNLKKSQEKNLMEIKNSDDYYINAACDNLKPFEDLKKEIFEKAILDNKKEIRIICDIPNFLFRNKHFDQCIALEELWNQTIEELNKRHGLNVSLLCLYNSNNFQNAPFKYHGYRINDNHSIVCDSEGIVHSQFDSLTRGRKRKSEKA
ncbi:MAG TPA: MEDS domain-containing protein [Nitrososphaeraceae archaeon]|nr:MEDS domain-containing protein [Nitrososphaeraceae archaeon]